MTSRAYVEQKARELAAFELQERGLNERNTSGLSVEEHQQLRADAMIARDRAAEARAAYQNAFAQWRFNGFKN